MSDPEYIIVRTIAGDLVKTNSNLLKKYSGYFAAALRHHSASAEYINLPEVIPCTATFIVFECWLRTGSVSPEAFQLALEQEELRAPWKASAPTTAIVLTKTEVLDAKISTAAIDLLIACWVLGDVILAPGFQNYIMHRLVSEYDLVTQEHGMPVHNLEYVMLNTTATSNLRHFIIDALYAYLSPQTMDLLYRKSLGLPEDLLLYLAIVGLEHRMGDSLTMGRAPWAFGVDEKIYYTDAVDWEEEYTARDRRVK